MKCPVCGKPTVILETRHNEITNTSYRRRECDSTDTHRFTTVESIAAVGAKRAPKRPVVAVPKSGRDGAGVAAPKAKPKAKTPK